MVESAPISPSEFTVDELEQHVEEADYSVTELRAIRAAETADVDPRSTAIDAIDEELNALTSGPSTNTVPAYASEEGEDELDYDESMRIVDGGGATEIGVVGVDLPDPYSDAAPDTLRITIDAAMGVAGIMFDNQGEHSIPYAMPNDEGVSGMRVKRTLEAGTNIARLSRADALHPEHEG